MDKVDERYRIALEHCQSEVIYNIIRVIFLFVLIWCPFCGLMKRKTILDMDCVEN